jgi:feruloyl esterase
MTAADACAALKGTTLAAADISLPTSGATVTASTLVAAAGAGVAATGEYCHVTGTIAPVDRTAPVINFDMSLPTTWNTKAVHLMYGGYDGILVDSTGQKDVNRVPGARGAYPQPLARGYAVFGSDSGHTGSPFDASFAMNNEALENYLGDQLRKTRDVAVNLIQRRYGNGPSKTYSIGGSGGGREALYVVDRWPALYDGAISYFPAWSLTAMLTNYAVHNEKLAAPGAWSNPTKQALLTQSVIAACDALDGVTDGVVSNVAACQFDPQSLRCLGGADTGNTCLSDAQIAGFTAYATKLTYPYTLANGTNSYAAYNIFNGGVIPAMGTTAPATPANPTMPFATAIGEPFVKYWIYRDPSFTPFTFDLNANEYTQQREMYISSRQDINPNLTPFATKGGKVLIVHGLADPLIPAGSSEEFYNRAVAAMGAATVASFLKFYEVPGYGHDGGNFLSTWDSLTALENWVEKGTAPANPVTMDATAGHNSRTRPLCEFPKWPKYNGTGDVNAASSFTCSP